MPPGLTTNKPASVVPWDVTSSPLDCRRADFAIPREIAYLNCAYMGPLSGRVLEAGRHGLERKARPWTVRPEEFFEPVEEVRALFARLIGGDADGVALLPSVSYGIALAARNMPAGSGRSIVTLAEEFPSAVYAWQRLAQDTGAVLRTVPRPADDDWTAALLEAVDDTTAVVASPVCHWTDGTAVDLGAVGRRAREVGAALVVDGTQSIGAVPFDVTEVLPDVVVTAPYKWMLGPYSMALAWWAPEHRGGEPLEHSWMTRAGSDDFANLVDYASEFRPGARRYDVGQTSNFALLPALRAALEQTLEWGVDRIAAYIGELTAGIADGADRIGLGVADPQVRSPHLVGVRLGAAEPESMARALAEAEVYVSVRGDAVRVSPHVYNDYEDVERLIRVLQGAL